MTIVRQKWIVLGLTLAIGGCAGPAPTPPQPKVPGLEEYVDGARAYERGDTDAAQRMLEDAIRTNGDLTMARALLAEIYKKKKDFRHSSLQLEVAVKLDPYSAKNHYDLAIAYQFLDRLEEAAAQYLATLSLSPNDLKSHINLGLVYLALGRSTMALSQLELAVRIDPTSSIAQCNLGVVYDATGQPLKAETAYMRSLELDPDQTVAISNLGINLVRQQRGDEAAVYLRKALQKNDSAPMRKHYADALFLGRHDDLAMSQYHVALQKDPQYWPAMNQLGLVYINQYKAGLTLDEGLRQQALDFWNQSLTLQPDQPIIRQWVTQWTQNGKLVP